MRVYDLYTNFGFSQTPMCVSAVYYILYDLYTHFGFSHTPMCVSAVYYILSQAYYLGGIWTNDLETVNFSNMSNTA